MSGQKWRKVWTMARETKRRGTTYSIRWYDSDGRMRTQSVGPGKRHAEDERRRKEMQLNFNLDALNRTPEQCAFEGVKHVPVEGPAPAAPADPSGPDGASATGANADLDAPEDILMRGELRFTLVRRKPESNDTT